MKKFRILLLTGMILGATAFAGCGKMAEDDINNKEVFSDDLEPLTEEELDAMDADTSDDDMEAIDEPSEDDAQEDTQEDTQDSAQDNKKNTDKNTEDKNTTNKNVNKSTTKNSSK